MSKAHKRMKVDNATYRSKKEDKQELSDIMSNIDAIADKIAEVSSIYNQRCLIANPGEVSGDMDQNLKAITASAITDLREAFNKIAEAEDMLGVWFTEHKRPFLGKLLFF